MFCRPAREEAETVMAALSDKAQLSISILTHTYKRSGIPGLERVCTCCSVEDFGVVAAVDMA